MGGIIVIGFLYVFAEITLAFIFSIIAQVYYKKLGMDFKSILKGALERLFLTISFIHDMAAALTFFSALKLATRLKHEESKEDHNKFNDYYLMGNLASVTMAVLYVYTYNNIDTLPSLLK